MDGGDPRFTALFRPEGDGRPPLAARLRRLLPFLAIALAIDLVIIVGIALLPAGRPGDLPGRPDGQGGSRTGSRAGGSGGEEDPRGSPVESADPEDPDRPASGAPPGETEASGERRGDAGAGRRRTGRKTPPAARDALAAARRALDWLARHQDDDGRIGARTFPERCAGPVGDRCDGVAVADDIDDTTTAVTALALLACGRDGETTDPLSGVLDRAVRFLLPRRNVEGGWGPRTGRRPGAAHALVTLVFSEILLVADRPDVREAARRAATFLAESADLGEFRRTGSGLAFDRPAGVAFSVLALRSARRSDIAVSGADIRDFTEALFHAAPRPEPLRGLGLFALAAAEREATIPGPSRTAVRAAVTALAATPTLPSDFLDTEEALFTALGLVAADPLAAALERLRESAMAAQESRGCAAGSFPPSGPSGAMSGRAFSTAMGALALALAGHAPAAARLAR